MRYVDPVNFLPTIEYPMNPNGSAGGVAGMLSEDGRVFGLMPHPERCFKSWQLPWAPEDWAGPGNTPWLKIFQNAREWCCRGEELRDL